MPLNHLTPAQASRVSTLLDEFIAVAPGQREAWLADLQSGDPESAVLLREILSAREVLPSEGLFARGARVVQMLAATLDSDHGPLGKVFGPYRVRALLGHGGMGSVWLAERVDGLFTRQVALKLLHPALVGQVMTARFAREREILAGLTHPHIARLFDAGFSDDGQPFLALEYVDGVPLTTYCDQHRLPVRQRLELFLQVLSAVEYAHLHLVVHRDLKPSNILVTADGQVQLLDFGIAKLLIEGQAKETELTQVGGRALTPDYAAPEQIVGAAVTTSADVYALGVMLYELLTGERPYRLSRDSRGALEDAILQAEPLPPSRIPFSGTVADVRDTTAKRLAKALKGDLDTIVSKALKKAPKERYATANALREDIARYLRGEAVLAQPESLIYRAVKFTRRHRVALSVAGALLLALAGGLAATSYEARVASTERDAALQAQSQSLTQTAAARLRDGDVTGATGIILEVLTNPAFAHGPAPAAINVFQDIRAADAQLAVLSGHADVVRSAAYSPDGTRIVTASYDKSAWIWDALTGVHLAVLSGHGNRVTSAAYSPDGTRIVTASADKTARIWEARTGAPLAVLSGHLGRVNSAAYSPDGTRIVTASSDKTARIWEAHTGAPLAVLSGHGDAVEAAAYSPDGTRIITASDDKTARIWEAHTGAQLAALSGHGDVVVSVAYSPDGTRIVTTSQDKTARTWDAHTGVALAVLSGHGGRVNSAGYSPDGTRIVTASSDKTARVWEAHTGAQLAALSGHGDGVVSAAYSPDGTRIVTGSFDKTARMWEARTGMPLAMLSGHDNIVVTAAYSPDGTRIVTASDDKTARIWDAHTGAQLAVLSGHGGMVYDAAYSPDDTRVVTASADNTAWIWEARTGAPLAVLSGHGAAVEAAAYSPDGIHIVTASLDKTARIWDAHTGAQFAVLSGHGGMVYDAAYSPDGTRIVTASFDRTARIWEALTGAPLAVLSGHTGIVVAAAYSPDGTRVVTASNDRTARVWEARTGTQLAVLSGHRDNVNFAAYSPDGAYIVTASDDRTARIWEARTGTQLAVLSHGDAVESAAYSPDGTRIVTASNDRTARVWDARVPANLAAQILWDAAAETDPLPDADRAELGLLPDAGVRKWRTHGSACDQAAAAFYDPDRLAAGLAQAAIVADLASSACSPEAARTGRSARSVYQMGRALLAEPNLKAARQQFELAVSAGYRAARIDLADLLVDGSAGMLDPDRAVLLYQQAWQDGVPIAAFALGHLYEEGISVSYANAASKFHPDLALAWSWYEKGANAGEPHALARFAERDERDALGTSDPQKRTALALTAFRYYAAAAERAHHEDWPDDAWRNWRHRRATLARLLAREGRMSEVAQLYDGVFDHYVARPPTLGQRLSSFMRID